MNLKLIKDECCPTCGSKTVSESCRHTHCSGEGFEERTFACGCTLSWSPNFSRLEVTEECAEKIKQRKLEELKKPLPCPWCGSAATVYNTQRGDMIGVQCSTQKCTITTLGPHRKTAEDAIAAWNTRWEKR